MRQPVLARGRHRPPRPVAGGHARIDLRGGSSRFDRLSALCAVLVVMGFTDSPAAADSMRCGTKLVSDGDSAYEVHTRCGEPKFKTKRTELRTIRTWVGAPCVSPGAQCGHAIERTIEVQVEEWTYDFGPTQFVRFVTFEDGRLLRIITGDYGSSG